MEDEDHLRAYIIASSAGVYSLFPLLIKPIGNSCCGESQVKLLKLHGTAETPIKVIFTLLWCGLVFSSLRRVVYR